MQTSKTSAPDRSTVRSTRRRHFVGLGGQIVAVAIAAFAVFNMGTLWSIRAFARIQALAGPQLHPDPFLVHFIRYAVATLWPIPGAALLFLAASGFERGRRRWWMVVAAAVAWFGAYYLIKTPQMYYYWLSPVQSQ